ncbi:amidohydrolase family protein [Henriciella sp.]|uniref:amidohydrolase family protein n=1 Tax=Henriciella sp. TaxID=1968823 RepID=UPI0025BFC8EA|nr:amidohydrolase family protein [Henriciella sp.]
MSIRLALITLLHAALATFLPAIAQSPDRVIFDNVHILTMTPDGDIETGHVIVEGSRITTVAEGSAPATSKETGALIIDGKGQTLMPGLTDMHVHYWEMSAGVVYLANSITRVRNLTGATYATDLDLMALTGQVPAPRVYTTGPLIDGAEPVRPDGSVRTENADQARGVVRSQAASGYPAIKLYSKLSPESFTAAVEEARAAGLKIFCHVPETMTVSEVLALKVDSIEHFDGYAEALVRDGFTTDARYPWAQLWANADPAKFDALAAETAAAGTALVPTFALIYGRFYSADPDEYFARPESAYLPSWSAWWPRSISYWEENRPYFKAQLDAKIAFARAAREAGVTLLIGTDAPNPFTTPGWAIHDEIEAFSRIGYTNREILDLATRIAADFLGEEGQSGIIAKGARADIVLLPSSPIEDLAALRTPTGAMVNGHWHDRAALDAALETRAARSKEGRERMAGQSSE